MPLLSFRLQSRESSSDQGLFVSLFFFNPRCLISAITLSFANTGNEISR